MTNIEKVTHYIGIDISKKTLDIAIYKQNSFLFHEQINNTPTSLKTFFKSLNKRGVDLSQSIVCAEFTGVYTQFLINSAQLLNLNLWLENGNHIKKSQGLKRGKNDKVDAQRIAQFAYKNKDDYKAYQEPRALVKTLKELINRRKQLVSLKKQLSGALGEKEYKNEEDLALLKSLCENTLNGLETDLKRIEREIDRLIKSDEKMFNQYKIINSVVGMGPVTAANMIMMTNEFSAFLEAKKFACYAGVVPFSYTSGSSVSSKAKVSKMANHQMKTLLHMAAMSCIRSEGNLREYYLRKTEEGKNKMSVINAIRNKLILRVFACIRDNRFYDKDYKYSTKLMQNEMAIHC